MPLTSKLVLEIDAFDRTGVFEFRGDLSPARELTKQYLVGGRGQIISELYNQLSGATEDALPDTDLKRRRGFFLDAGAGQDQIQVTAEVGRGDGDLRWGDGSSASGSANAYDAEGDVDPQTKRDVLHRYLSARSDSGGQVRLYYGEWTDGTYASSAGLYGEPLPVAVRTARSEKPADEPTVVSYTFEFEVVSVVPDVDALVSDFSTAAEKAVAELGDEIDDY